MRRLRLDGLIRVSQKGDREGEDFRSPVQQREVCERWATGNNADIRTWHEAIDVSGKTVVRADVDAAVARIRAGQTDGVIVAWLDRFSRAPVGEALRVYDDIQAAGGQVVACDMAGLRPDDPTGELALTVMLAVNRMQWRKLAERWDITQRDAIKAGKAMGGAPFGYRFTDPTPRQHGRGVTDSRLVPDERYAAIVRELFERKAAGATWLELARWLDAVAPKPEGRRWARTSVQTIIKCKTYLGQVQHGEHVRAGAHEPLVSASLWRRAQNPPGRRTPRGTYLLSGLVRCARCTRSMEGSLRHEARIYVCRNHACPARSNVRTTRLDAEVVGQFFARLDEFHARAIDDDDVTRARVEVERLTGEVERLAAVVPTHPAAIAAHQRALDDAERALTDAEDRLSQLMSSAAQTGPDIRELRADWPLLSLDEQREILRAGIDAVLVRRALQRGVNSSIAARVRVVFRGEAPAGLLDNGRGLMRSWTWDDDPGSLSAAT